MRVVLLLFLSLVFLQSLYGAKPKKPKITGQKALSTSQGRPITIHLTDLIVEEKKGGDDDDEDEDKNKGNGDKDDEKPYPAGYELEIFDGENYQVSGTSVTPSPDFTGDLTVDVRVKNEKHASNKFDLKITVIGVTPANKPPVITGQSSLTTRQNTALEIRLSDLIVSDPDDQYPSGFSLKLFPGEHYAIEGLSVRPETGYSGTLKVGVSVNDGKASSEAYSLSITVIPVSTNVLPVITGQVALATEINKPVTVQLAHLTVQDPDNAYPTGFTLKVSTGAHYSANNTTVTPEKDFTGRLIIPVIVNDGKDDSKPFDFVLIVKTAVNVPPVIAGQMPISISKNQRLTLVLSHLMVTDPDNAFPSGFVLNVRPSENYTLKGNEITPSQDFTGDLVVPVFVSDGTNDSQVYLLKITVASEPNARPVITGQVGLKIIQGQNLALKLSHLVVNDPDNQYPQDFTLTVSQGDHYTLADHVITPAPNYVGTLHVKVVVQDGIDSSDPFDLVIQVVPQGTIQILGQQSLEAGEDSSLTIRLSDLIVSDPTNSYPDNYTLEIETGDHYKVSKASVIPEADFHGNLTVPLTIRKGSQSASYVVLIVVTPVNDPPVLLKLPTDPLRATGSGPWPLATNVEVEDVDSEQLLYAEIGFEAEDYEPLEDRLSFEDTDNIHGIFDPGTGVLFLLGKAGLDAYQRTIRNVNFSLLNQDDSVRSEHKKIYLRLHDGQDISDAYSITILINGDVALDIPSAFTPNNDQANDTWKITPLQDVDKLNTIIRVYNQKGLLVFETRGLDVEWDGQLNGTPLPADVYFYTIELDLDYRKLSYKGIVAILR